MTKENILVTGGDGNIGSEVIKQLSSNGADFRIVAGVHSIAKNGKRFDHHDLVEIDYENPEIIRTFSQFAKDYTSAFR
jgi:nucleoside-diphosphate-sugar epimerase